MGPGLRQYLQERPRLRRGLIIGSATVVLVSLGLLAYTGYRRQYRQPAVSCGNSCTPIKESTATPKPTAPPATPIYSPVDGLPIDASKAAWRPLAVMIENHPDARPQSGLGQANLVYEAIAEGGITRFMAVYRDPSVPVKVGPIRSARTYFLDYAEELQAFFAHVGGNMDALDRIKAENVFDLDQFAVGSPVYHREYTRNVATEHTMYSDTSKLWTYATSTKGWPQNASVPSWLYTDDAPAAERPASQTVSVSVSSASYDVKWAYDPATNAYKRSMAGKPHVDANTNEQIAVKNVVLQEVSRTPTVTRINEQGWIYGTTGSGPVTVINNGTAIKGTWKKEGTGRTRFYDANGKEIPLVRGTTWIELVHSDSQINL